MKKFYLSMIMSLLLCAPALAKTIEVEALSDFSSVNPPKTMSVKVVVDVYNDENQLAVPKGTIINGKIVDVKDPKRLKRNATFSFVPTTYTDANGNVNKVKRHFQENIQHLLTRKNLQKMRL